MKIKNMSIQFKDYNEFYLNPNFCISNQDLIFSFEIPDRLKQHWNKYIKNNFFIVI